MDIDVTRTKLPLHPNPNHATKNHNIPEELGRTCTDHMIAVSWTHDLGWHAPELRPYGPISLQPTASCLHYATECFEGFKLYRGWDGKLRLFRPELNAQRMLYSAKRVCLPEFSTAEFQKLVALLCVFDGGKWLPPDQKGQFLYVRPAIIADDDLLSINGPKKALLFIVMSHFSRNLALPRDKSNCNKGLRLYAPPGIQIRSWPGGFGDAKIGANYGPGFLAQREAVEKGCDMVLWLFGPDRIVTEAGASNIFVVWRTRDGRQTQLVTPPLDDGLILDGITRRSVLELAQQRLDFEVLEKAFSVQDILDCVDEGRLIESFVTGTAFFVRHVQMVNVDGRETQIPMPAYEGSIAYLFKTWLEEIMYGKIDHDWGRVLDESTYDRT